MMRSSTPKAMWAGMPLLFMGLTMLACIARPASAAYVEDRSTDAAEKHRVAIFAVEDHSRDAIERLKGGAF